MRRLYLLSRDVENLFLLRPFDVMKFESLLFVKLSCKIDCLEFFFVDLHFLPIPSFLSYGFALGAYNGVFTPV